MEHTIVDYKLLQRLEVKSGLSPEQITARLQDKGIKFTYRQYKNLIKNGRLPRVNANDILEGLENLFSCKISLDANERDKAA